MIFHENIRRLFLSVLLILPVIASRTFSQTPCANCHYVRQGATGSGAGADWTNAYVALPSNLQRGHTYYIADGNYGGYSFDDPELGDQRITIKKATTGDHGAETGWQAGFGDGQAKFTGTATYYGTLEFPAGYYVIDGQTRNENDWTDTDRYGIRVEPGIDGTAVYIQNQNIPPGGDHIVFKHMDIGGTRAQEYPDIPNTGFYLIDLDGSMNVFNINRCHVHNVGLPFYFINAHDGIVEYSHIGPCWAKEAIRGRLSSSNWIVRHNVFVDNGFYAGPTTGLTAEIGVWSGLGPFDNWEIYGNIFWNTLAGQSIMHNNGIIAAGFEGPPANNWKVYNNVFAGISGSQATILLVGSNNHAHNNLWYDISASTISCQATSCSNNWCMGGDCDNLLSQWPTTIIGQSDPFVGSAAGGFGLKDPALVAGPSPVDAGLSLAAGYDPVDAKGVTRPQGTAWDIGAYEYVAGTPALPQPRGLRVRTRAQ